MNKSKNKPVLMLLDAVMKARSEADALDAAELPKRITPTPALAKQVHEIPTAETPEVEVEVATRGLEEIEIDPAQTRMNPIHRRSPAQMSGASIQDLADQIAAHGQQMPALGWFEPEADEEGRKVTLVYGARRRAACLSLGQRLRVRLLPRPLTGRELVVVMHAENEGRENYTPLDRAREYAAFQEETGLTAAALFEALGVERTKGTRLMSLLKLPPEVLETFTDPAWLPLMSGAELAKRCQEDADACGRVLKVAAEWKAKGQGGNPLNLYLAAMKTPVVRREPATFYGKDRHPVGQCRQTDALGGIAITLSHKAPIELRQEIADLLRRYYPNSGV